MEKKNPLQTEQSTK